QPRWDYDPGKLCAASDLSVSLDCFLLEPDDCFGIWYETHEVSELDQGGETHHHEGNINHDELLEPDMTNGSNLESISNNSDEFVEPFPRYPQRSNKGVPKKQYEPDLKDDNDNDTQSRQSRPRWDYDPGKLCAASDLS
nr:hypothetical protein [Tanacetum cinerariifolium]